MPQTIIDGLLLALKDPEVALGWARARRGQPNLLHKTTGYVFRESAGTLLPFHLKTKLRQQKTKCCML